MKLKQFRIQNYRSIVDSGIIDVADITALIGANESGKSSVLQGLASISMDSHYDPFDLTELNRTLKKFQDLELKAEDIKIVWAKFDLSKEDEDILKSILKADGQAVNVTTSEPEESESKEKSTSNSVTSVEDPSLKSPFEVSKYFDETYEIIVGGERTRICSRYLFMSVQKKIKSILSELEARAKKDHLTRPPNNRFTQQFDGAIEQAKALSSCAVLSNQKAKRHLQNLGKFLKLGADQQFNEEIQSYVSRVSGLIDRNFPNSKLEVSLFNYLLSRMPRTVYFKTYERMEDDVSLTELKTKPELHMTFHNFLTLAEIKLDTVERLKDDEKMRQVYIENGCGKATQLLREAWHQEILDVELRFSEDRFMVFTKNSKAVETLLPPSRGSEGFQWFFGFYINFGAATDAEYKRAILLLDDPGVFLHPKGQKDLLALLEGYLKHDVTTIYSTHLPFMIPRDNLKRLRLVEKKPRGRTHLTAKFYAVKDKDILYPLRAALGVTLGDSLFVGEKTVVAEGLCDRILLNGMMEEYSRRGIRKMVDLDKIEILAGEGVPGAKNHALMLQIQSLPYVVVLDNDGEGRKGKKDLEEEGIIPEENVILLPCDKSQEDFDIEDLFPLDIYVEAFQTVHGRFLNLTPEKIKEHFKKGNKKVSNRAADLLKKSKTKFDLDKVRIAYEILGIVNQKKKLEKELTRNFDALFDHVDRVIGLYE